MGMLEIGPREEMKKLANTPANKRLKYCAIGAISVSIVLMLIMTVFLDSLSYRAMLWMRGFTGLGAIIFAILYGWLIYRINREYIQRK